jgi:hypothetical protein
MRHNRAVCESVTRQAFLALACWIAFFAPTARAQESVVYAIGASEAQPGAPVSNTQFRTEIFAVLPETGKQRLVFSDANAPFFLLTGAVVAAGGRIFAEGIERNRVATGKPAYVGPEALYELSTDGSGQARKVFDLGSGVLPVDFQSLFFDSLGSKVGNISFVDGKAYLFVRDTETGKLLRKRELSGWRFGSGEKIGWMPDNQRIFFTEAFPGVEGPEALWTTPGSLVGTYVLDENGTAERLAPEAELHPKVAGMQPSNDSPAFLIGTLPDGELLLHDFQHGPDGGGVYLYELDLAKKTQKIFPLQAEGNADAFHLSRSGERLAFAGMRKEHPKQLQFAAISSVWLMELKSGQQGRLLSFPTHDEARGVAPWINLIGWLDKK